MLKSSCCVYILLFNFLIEDINLINFEHPQRISGFPTFGQLKPAFTAIYIYEMTLITGTWCASFLAAVASLSAAILIFIKWSFTYWNKQGVYTLPPTVPFGNAINLIKQKEGLGIEMRNVYNEIKKAGKPYGGYYFLIKPIFIPVDLDLIKLIMTKDFAYFSDHVNHVNEEIDPLSGNLFALKGLKWKSLRTKLTPTFSSGKMKMMFHTLVECTRELVEVTNVSATTNEIIDIKDLVARYTTDVIGSCAFGIKCNSLKDPNSEFRKYGRKTFDTTLRDSILRLMTFTVPEILNYVNIRTFHPQVSNFFMNLARETVDYREENNIIRKDFMHLLIQLKNNVSIKENDLGVLKTDTDVINKAETSITFNELAAQAFVFFVAGYETSSTTAAFCLYELVQNLDLQDKLREEINTTLKKYGGEITYDAIMEMNFMDKCVCETLRKYPPVPIHTRECTQTYNVPNSKCVLKKGTFVFISVMGIHFDPEYYPNPDVFDPERFSEENKARRPASAWSPFGEGPRACIGVRFGMMQIKVVLTALIKDFTFSLNPRTETPLTLDRRHVFLSAENGIWLNAKRI